MKARKAKRDNSSSAQKLPTAKKAARTEKSKLTTTAAPKGKKTHTATADTLKRKEQILVRKEPYKGTLNTHDIMHSPVEKTIRMLEKIIAGERLFTM